MASAKPSPKLIPPPPPQQKPLLRLWAISIGALRIESCKSSRGAS